MHLHDDSADLVMRHVFANISLYNVNHANMMYLAAPDPSWATVSHCGDFPCTGRENVLIRFEGELEQEANIPI